MKRYSSSEQRHDQQPLDPRLEPLDRGEDGERGDVHEERDRYRD